MLLLKIIILLSLTGNDEVASEKLNQIESNTTTSNQIDVESGKRHDDPGIRMIRESLRHGPEKKVSYGSSFSDESKERRRRRASAPRGGRGSGRNGHMGRLPRRRRRGGGGYRPADAPPTCKKSNNVFLALIPFWICALKLDNAYNYRNI